ncbi:MAG: Mur ligase family protein [Bacteroidia bacterium]|nr:Mur ligase family protein [Bacteroidia bacterium]
MRIHLIAMGGAVMHNLAIALHQKGYQVSGSDDEIFDPARSRLAKVGLLPLQWGWYPEKITPDINAVILGMHARADNPELERATGLGLRIFSFPEYLYEQSRNKKRVVIGGSHGKTTITSMIMHVLRYHHMDFDYMVGSQLEGFDTMVRITEEAPIAVFEGDEYLSSATDLRPKFHLYKPHVALLSGIAWDHINVFPTFENYIEQFRKFIGLIEKNGTLIYCQNDELLGMLTGSAPAGLKIIPYTTHESITQDGVTSLITDNNSYKLKIFGKHNLQNINGARLVCKELGVGDGQFYEAICSFAGAAKRLQLLAKNEHTSVFLDFAHSPSKLMATIKAVKEQFPARKLVACMELHTFSSLNMNFLSEYAGTMLPADIAYVYFDPHTIEHKRLPAISPEMVAHAFGGSNIEVFTEPGEMTERLLSTHWHNSNLLLMSSGNFSGIDFPELAQKVVN